MQFQSLKQIFLSVIPTTEPSAFNGTDGMILMGHVTVSKMRYFCNLSLTFWCIDLTGLLIQKLEYKREGNN